MPESSDPSVQNTSIPNYISKMVAIALLQEILENQEIDEDLKNRLLKEFCKNLKKYPENLDLIQNLSIKVKVFLSLEGIEISVPEGVEVEFSEVRTDLITRVRPELGATMHGEGGGGWVETESLSAPLTLTVKKCEHPLDGRPNCRIESTQVIESLMIMR